MRLQCSLSGVLLALLFILCSSASGSLPSGIEAKIGASLALLTSLYREHPELVPEDARALSSQAGVQLNIKFSNTPQQVDVDHIRQLGAIIAEPQVVVPDGVIKLDLTPWNALPEIAALPSIQYIDSVWQPCVVPTLDLSALVVDAPAAWQLTEQAGVDYSPSRTVIADFDTLVDVFHPALWRADGPEYSWIDVDSDGSLSPGIDAVDLNGNGWADPGEALSFIKAPVKDCIGEVTNTSGPFVAGLDWLYNDANCNGIRDFGTSFGNWTPVFGEPVFVPRNPNLDGSLAPGTKLVALGTSKIAAILGPGGIVYDRGSSLINAPPDTTGHGTAVCGILSSRSPGLGSFVGISPGVDIVVADRSSNSFTQYIPWAEAQGAKVMLYEFGSWTFQFMDGTSPLEQAISAEWDKGITQVIAAGNLANGRKHAIGKTSTGTNTFSFTVPEGRDITTVYLSVLWRPNTKAMTFELINPLGGRMILPGDKSFLKDSAGNWIWSFGTQKSPRNTKRFDIYISGVTVGDWGLVIEEERGKQITMHAYIADNIGGWSGGVFFNSGISTENTVSWPATADKVIVVGSFSTRGIVVEAGDVSNFSGCGPRIDGMPIIDVCAPGNYDVFTPCSKDDGNPFGSYKQFSGTSAAAPHVASACALLLQINPSLSPEQIESLIKITASSDTFTGITPNNTWGQGKLAIGAAAVGAIGGTSETAASAKTRPDGDTVTLFGKLVIAVFPDLDCFYIEEGDRSSGIRVQGSGVVEGDKAQVVGVMTTVGVERAVNAGSIEILQREQVLPGRLAMSNRSMGSPQVSNLGPENTGMLITIWGRIVSSSADMFIIDDGSCDGVRVYATGLQMPSVGEFAIATGVSCLELDGGQVRRALRPRRQSDLITAN